MTKHGKAKRGIPPKSDFNAWYPAIVEISDLVDKRYPIKVDFKGISLSTNLDDTVKLISENKIGRMGRKILWWS